MRNFIFQVKEFENFNNLMQASGYYHSGCIKHGESVRLLDYDGSITTIKENIYSLITSRNQNYYDRLIINCPFSRENAFDVGEETVWFVDSNSNLPYLVVQDVFSIKGRGVVITGSVSSGGIKLCDNMSLITPSGVIKDVVITGIEKFRVQLREATTGDAVGLVLGGIKNKEDIPSGSLLCSRINRYEEPFIQTTQHTPQYTPQHTPQQTPQYSPQHTPQYTPQHTPITNNRSRKKFALLIGNCNYNGRGDLRCCINDATDLGQKLRNNGFDVTLVQDGTYKRIVDAINTFSQRAIGADVCFVFYSGHGLQCDGKNYIIPTDARLSSKADVIYTCINMSYIIDKLSDYDCKMKILVLDACRTNPFTKSWYKGDVNEGLCETNSTDVAGTVIAYATSPNKVAYDGGYERNSPYTSGLLKMLDEKPALNIVNYFSKVSSYVFNNTSEKQQPWFSCSALTGEFFLADNNTTTQSANTSIPSTSTTTQGTKAMYDIYVNTLGTQVVKVDLAIYLRDRFNISGKEAWNIVYSIPTTLVRRVDESTARQIKSDLEKIGAVVELRIVR